MKTAVITGGSGGIGKVIATEFKLNGYNVAVFYHNGQEVASELEKSGIFCYRVDIANSQSVTDAFNRVRGDFGRISTLINCAGVTKIAPISLCSESDFDNIVGVNLKGTFLCCKEVLPDMFALDGGDIINISSVWGERPASCEVVYSATKGGINAFTLSLAEEMNGTGIKVNAVSVGFADTPINKGLSQEEVSAFLKENGFKRAVTPEEIAQKCIEIVRSDLSGQIIRVYGEEI